MWVCTSYHPRRQAAKADISLSEGRLQNCSPWAEAAFGGGGGASGSPPRGLSEIEPEGGGGPLRPSVGVECDARIP